MFINSKYIILHALLCFLLGFVACSKKPSDESIKIAIIEYFQKNGVPPSWAGSLLGGKDAEIQAIDIEEIGNYNNDKKYWPIKARIRGDCKADFLVSRETRSFDRIGEFYLYEDDFGKLNARLTDK